MLLKWSSCPASLGEVIGTTVEPFSFVNDEVSLRSSSGDEEGWGGMWERDWEKGQQNGKEGQCSGAYGGANALIGFLVHGSPQKKRKFGL